MPKFSDETINKIDTLINRADCVSDRFYWFNVVIAVALAGLGSATAGVANIHPNVVLVLGILTACLAALNKAVDPGAKAERVKVRKRILELLSLEATKEKPRLSEDEIHRFILLSKHDAQSVLEEVLRRTSVSSN